MSEWLHRAYTKHIHKFVGHRVYVINVNSVRFVESHLDWRVFEVGPRWILATTSIYIKLSLNLRTLISLKIHLIENSIDRKIN